MKLALAVLLALVVAAGTPASAASQRFATGFAEHTFVVEGRTLFYRIGGSGPVVVLLHGFGDTGDMWAPLAPRLATRYTVIVPDLPGLGRSRPDASKAHYDMASVARVMHAFMVRIGVRREAVIAHDIGLMVAYAYAAQFPKDVTKLALMDAPIPGVGPWQQVLLTQATVQFHFFGPYAEKLTAGRERIYLDHIWDTFAYHPDRVTGPTRARYAASYAQPGNMHAAFSYFAGFYDDARVNLAFAKTPLQMPVLAMGGEKSFGAFMPLFAKAVAVHVQTSVIPDAGHWLMDENASATMAALVRFLSGPS